MLADTAVRDSLGGVEFWGKVARPPQKGAGAQNILLNTLVSTMTPTCLNTVTNHPS